MAGRPFAHSYNLNTLGTRINQIEITEIYNIN